MHFSQEAFKSSQFKFKDDHLTTLDEITAGCSAGSDTIFCQNEDFLAFDELVGLGESNNSSLKTIAYFFPNADQIDARLNDGPNLINSVENSLPQNSKHLIDSILDQINKLSPVEKLMLYLKLPTGKDLQDPLKLPINPLGSRTEITQTIAWIKTHLKEDKDTSVPKQDVYTEYMEFCRVNSMKPLSTADFGKVMKQVYPNVRPRRLGTRGNSRYCYSGMTCRTELPTPSLPTINCDEGERTCAWAAQVLGTPISSLTELEAHLASRGLPTSSRPVVTPAPVQNDSTYCMSSKISKSAERRPSETETKRKAEDDSTSTRKTPPERCKGKKRSSLKKSDSISAGENSKSEEEDVKRSKAELTTPKLPIPRLPRNLHKPELPFIRKLPKPLQPKHEQMYLENGNSLEQEEEMLRYFQTGDDSARVSQLRLLLEKKEDKAQVRRRVSFETVPESPKKFSFAPISPVSPFVQPQRVLHRSCSVSSPVGKAPITKPPLPVPSERSQSVPMLLPQDTPIPTEIIDFGLDSESNLLVIEENSDALLIDSGMNNENLNTIFSILNEMENRSRSYPNTPTTSTTISYPPQLSTAPSTSTFFDDLDCDVTLSSLTADVTQLNSDIL